MASILFYFLLFSCYFLFSLSQSDISTLEPAAICSALCSLDHVDEDCEEQCHELNLSVDGWHKKTHNDCTDLCNNSGLEDDQCVSSCVGMWDCNLACLTGKDCDVPCRNMCEKVCSNVFDKEMQLFRACEGNCGTNTVCENRCLCSTICAEDDDCKNKCIDRIKTPEGVTGENSIARKLRFRKFRNELQDLVFFRYKEHDEL